MTNRTLADEYFEKAVVRLKALKFYQTEGAHSDVIRETQELVELLLKGLLRLRGIDPPKWHDVSSVIEENLSLFPGKIQSEIARIVKFSKYLRKEREMSFYGDEDFLPSEEYSLSDSDFCINEATWLLDLVKDLFRK